MVLFVYRTDWDVHSINSVVDIEHIYIYIHTNIPNQKLGLDFVLKQWFASGDEGRNVTWLSLSLSLALSS